MSCWFMFLPSYLHTDMRVVSKFSSISQHQNEEHFLKCQTVLKAVKNVKLPLALSTNTHITHSGVCNAC